MNPTAINTVNSGMASDAWYAVGIGFSVELFGMAVGWVVMGWLKAADGDGDVVGNIVGDGESVGTAIWLNESSTAGAVASGALRKGTKTEELDSAMPIAVWLVVPHQL